MTQTIEQRLAALEAAVGDPTLKLDANSPRPPELPNGQYNLFYSEYQLHVAANQYYGYGDDIGIIGRMQADIEGLKKAQPPAEIPADAAALVALLETLGVYVRKNRLGVGIAPEDGTTYALTIGGESAACIEGISNTKKTDGQNPDEVHKSVIVVSDNDGGMRAIQYGTRVNGQSVRNTTNRPLTAFAFMDSWGDTCISDSRFEPGQCLYIVKSDGNVTIATYKVGWSLSLKESVGQYGARDKQIL